MNKVFLSFPGNVNSLNPGYADVFTNKRLKTEINCLNCNDVNVEEERKRTAGKWIKWQLGFLLWKKVV